jgi:hypothetical protein
MSDQAEITAEIIESFFGRRGASHRFANFCNAVLVAETGGQVPSSPVLSEKLGADGSFDGEWNVPLTVVNFSNRFAEPGWKVFQFKPEG